MNYNDERGTITGIIQSGVWQEMNYITTRSGVVRGNHYHKKTQELFFIISGQIRITIYDVNKNDSANIFIAKTGDAFIIQPYEVHRFETQTDSSWINMLSSPIGKDDDADIFIDNR